VDEARSAEVLGAPLQVGPVEVRNRLSIAPHTVNFGITRGVIDDSFVAYLTRRSGGFGATIVPLAAPHPSGRAEPSQPWLWDDRWIPELARLAEALRATGTEPGLQINHGGRQTNTTMLDGEQPVAPSTVPARSIYRDPPRALTTGEIADLVASFADAATRGVEAGYRWINLHFAHGYLVSQFLSADANRREDAYGGPLENRMRFGLEIVEAVRAAVGADVVVDVRINGRDYVEGGIEVTDAIAFAKALTAAGADTLNVSGGVYGSDPFNLLLPFDGHEFLPLAAAVRGAAGVPVTGVGNVRFPRDAATAIDAGLCDLVGVARAVMADPDWARKATGELRTPLRPCLGTVDGCSERIRHFEPAGCQVMPELGRETRTVPPVVAPRRVLVVGAGPAGCEAATYAAGRGHEVTLVDEQPEVGGALRLIEAAPGGAPFGWLAEYYRQELERRSVELRLEHRATRQELAELDVDHLIVATGARSAIPDLRGFDVGPLAPVEDVLADDEIAPTTAIVLGASRRAVYAALAMADRGARVVMIDHRREGIARDASALMRRQYRRELARRGVRPLTVAVVEVLASGVRTADGVEVPGELIVVALDARSDRLDVGRIDPARVATIGDAKEPRSIMDAIAEARDAVEAIP
jgi:2,4-dienoyl-CoA reductase-like NADH-dependent reductase (Old Yellow Enzyme family)/thioredoxin reductase